MSSIYPMNTSFNRVIILVTGANRGLGLVLVKSLALHPSLPPATTIILLGTRNFDSGVRATHDLRTHHNIHNVIPIQLDVTSETSIRNTIGMVEETYGQLDVLVNNAGYAVMPSASSGEALDFRKAWMDTYNVNVISVASLTKVALPLLRKSKFRTVLETSDGSRTSSSGNTDSDTSDKSIRLGGKVIQISSHRASIQLNATNALPPTTASAYTVSKAALNMLTLDMARDPENAGVEFQIACPGHCRTGFNGFKGKREPEDGVTGAVELIVGVERRETGTWETKGDGRELVKVPW